MEFSDRPAFANPSTWRRDDETSPSERDGGTPPPGQTPRRAGPPGEAPRPPLSGPWLVVVSIAALGAVILWLQMARPTATRVPYSFFRAQLETDGGNIAEIQISDDILTGQWKNPPDDPEPPHKPLSKHFSTVLPPAAAEDKDLIPLLNRQKVKVTVESANWGKGANLLVYTIVTLAMIGFMWFLLRRTVDPMGAGGMVGNFIRSPAKKFAPSEQQVTFDDVAGMEQAKQELQEVVEFLKTPAKFQRLGAQIPKGVLLMGPPGTGKTLLARATAGEAGVPFYSINGSEFIQMFVGVGASRVRDLFRTAKETSPCIMFIDEIDAVGRVRGAGVGGGHDEREQTLNQILSEMDGFQQTEAVIVLAATNRPDVLDPALLRPGRFDRHVTIDRPTREGRLGILKVHTRKVPLSENVDLASVAAGTIGFSGADLRNLVNEAALNAARENKDRVEAADFEAAKDKVLMGPKREEVLNQHEKEMTAYHEAGHALVAWLHPELDPVHKVTIVPRGRALGVTQLLPEEERYHMGEKRLHSHLALAMGGRAAEKLVFDEYSAGAESDLKQATDLARRMVAHWGMSEAIGPVAFRQAEEHPFLGKEIHETRQFSEETTHTIDQEVQKFLLQASARATEMLMTHRAKLDELSQTLLEKEVLDKSQMEQILGARPAGDNHAPKLANRQETASARAS